MTEQLLTPDQPFAPPARAAVIEESAAEPMAAAIPVAAPVAPRMADAMPVAAPPTASALPELVPESGHENPRLALADMLLAEMGSSVGGRVWSPEVPKEFDNIMPTSAITVIPAGGGHMQGADRIAVFDAVMDVTCWGETRLQAEIIGDEALAVLREMEPKTWGGVYLRWVRIAGGVKSAIDPQTNWPFSLLTLQVLYSF